MTAPRPTPSGTAAVATESGSAQDRFLPGNLVSARGREWVVLPGSTATVLQLRPLSGTESDRAVLHIGLEPNVRPATFPPPSLEPLAGQDGARLLRDALLLSLRHGAGPFRSVGHLAFEPRAYQLVPLLLALKQEAVRLLIADDVGVGKSIEAGLIARELHDRGEIARLAVLCPPHLVDQWVEELDRRFHWKAAAVTAASADRLGQGIPQGKSLFDVYPFTVVSLDYIKAAKRRDEFAQSCPECIIVDEAHTCTNPGGGRQLRYDLLRRLVSSPTRHVVLLTATPHSGDEGAYFRLLGLLHPDFERLQETTDADRRALRERLANHFVQRRRKDLVEWQDETLFPQRQTSELTYALHGPWRAFFDHVLEYCATVTEGEEGDARRRQLTFWSTVALMRCVSSSPAAAAKALRTMVRNRTGMEMPSQADRDPGESLVLSEASPGDDTAWGEWEASVLERILDGTDDALSADDVEPGADTGHAALRALVDEADALVTREDDPKLMTAAAHVRQLLADGFQPVVFCRYIATAHYVAAYLARQFPGVQVDAVTGELVPAERTRRVEALMEHERRVLVATDCLSEGINLQAGFSAVVHYDLSWNPTRHDQREGRVDRYGQRAPLVRATMLYGADNAVDGAVLEVLLRKAATIQRELGILVPLPGDQGAMMQAVMRAAILRHRNVAQRELPLETTVPAVQSVHSEWSRLAERAKRNRTVFAQRSLKPDEVRPEFERVHTALGTSADVRRFVDRAMARLQAALDPLPTGAWAPIASLPESIRDRLAAEELGGRLRIDFHDPPAPGARFIHRSHPLVHVLADDVVERALADIVDVDPILGRVGRMGAWRSAAVTRQTLVLLCRLRHQLTIRRGADTRVLLVEEAVPVGLVGKQDPVLEIGPHIAAWLDAPATDLPAPARARFAADALEQMPTLRESLNAMARSRAETLLADHRRVRDAAGARGTYGVEALTPVDVIGAFVLVPMPVEA